MVALPICQITLEASKRSEKPYPKQLITIGDHIKKRRLDLNLTQGEVSKLIGVKEESIYNWENNQSKPKIYLMPKIIEFLGYVPFKLPNKTIVEQLKFYRKKHDLSKRKLAMLLDVNQTASYSRLGKWET